ncbi:cobyrinate a,c-diamide synthase [Roseomonas sp. USHLN139]|uniref:cobyrinate a,c-diamide synthase n=1 Tax=Roseomonas sp. USHLN139 TaxID=3081298 RepID=UPI003B0178C7
MQGLVVGAPRSGAGKTTLMLALLAAFRRRGLRVGAAKSGPDYIDPAFHEAASARPSGNLDSWAMPPRLLESRAAAAGQGLDLLLVESAMGLFDGAGAEPGRQGSAADLAARFGLPVLLLLDVSGQSQTAAALARGFATHRDGVRLAGVVLNRVASPRHRAGAAEAIGAIGLPVLGALPRDAALSLPERHLGLVQAREQQELPALLERLATLAETALDLDAILAAAAPLPATPALSGGLPGAPALPPPGQRIALADDAAFSFLYPHVAEGWRAAGATLHPFSPLADEPPPPGCDACWLPGGYPELHAGRLAAAGRFLDGLRRFAEDHPVHGECGGYMLLGQGLEDASGQRHAMAGLLSHATSFARRRMNLGYRQAVLLAEGPLGRAGTVLRGHEFHYATVTEAGDDAPLATLSDARGQALGAGGGQRGRVSGSFFHAIAQQEA